MKTQGWMAVVLAALMAACGGGSGSTGLVSSEGAVLHEVRRDGTCVTTDAMVTYCATDSPQAVSPGGASASGPAHSNVVPTATSAASPTPTVAATGAEATPTTAPGSTPSPQTTPCRRGDLPCPAPLVVQFTVRGLPAGAACALSARAANSADPWSTGSLAPSGGALTEVDLPVPDDVGPGFVEIALLCFEDPPTSLPDQLETLAAGEPDVVFAPAEAVEVPPAP
jgi:hypothetical protein